MHRGGGIASAAPKASCRASRSRRPDDQQIVCITLETNMLFARRMAAHLAQCPRSPHARNADAWQRTGSQYTAQFSDRRCKPAIRGYRG